MLRLSTFSALELADSDGREIRSVLNQPKRLALLVYLAASQPKRYHRRDSLLALFWPESDEFRARRALSQALHMLRRELGAGVLVSRGDEEVGVEQSELWCDAVVFEELLEKGETEKALDLYKGDFLPGFHLAGAPEFVRWLDQTRDRLGRCASVASRERAAHLEAEGALAEAALFARRALRISPLDETLARDLIRLLDGVGDRAEALQAYEAFADLLESEIGVTPAPETRQLVEEVRARTVARAEAPARPTAASPDETLSGRKRGEVQEVDAPDAAAVGTDDGESDDGPVVAPEPASIGVAAAMEGRRRTPRLLHAMGFAGIAALVGVPMWLGSMGETAPLDRTKIMIGGFVNRTAADSTDFAHLEDATFEALMRSGIATPVAAEDIEPGWTGANLSPSSGTRARLRRIARQAGAATAVWGFRDRVGDSVDIRGEIVDVESGRMVDVVEFRTAAASDPAQALASFRQGITGALVARIDPRFAEWKMGADGSPTFDAYLEFVRGVELYYGDGKFAQPEGAIERFAEACRLDPHFLTPRVWIVLARHAIGETAAADSLASVLAADLARLSLPDRYVLNHWLASREGRTGDALDEMRKAMILSPRPEYMPLAVLAALEAERPGEAVRWMTAADTVTGWANHWGLYSASLAWAHHALGDHEAELAPARRARLMAPDSPYMLDYEVRALAALAHPELDARLSKILEMELSPYAKGDALCIAAHELVGHGHRAGGAAMLNRCIQWDLERAEAGGDALRHRLSWSLIFARRFDEARPYLRALAEARPNNLNVIGPLAVLEAAQGNREEADRLFGFIDTHPVDNPYWESRRLYWRAAIAARSSAPQEAVRLLAEVVGESRSFRSLHADLFFQPLWNYPPFALLAEPRG